MTAGELTRIPQYFDTVHAYADTLPDQISKQAFYQSQLTGIEYAMHTNMGGGLPAAGFFEMKWDIYDIARFTGKR